MVLENSRIFKGSITARRTLGDTVTPVGMYLRLRQHFPGTFLLESADYRAADNCFSFICCKPVAEFRATLNSVYCSYPDGSKEERALESPAEALTALAEFCAAFQVEQLPKDAPRDTNGFFGYCTYDAVQCFEDIRFTQPAGSGEDIPLIRYFVFQYVFALNHFKNKLTLLENSFTPGPAPLPGIGKMLRLASEGTLPKLPPFRALGDETSNMTDAEHAEMIERCKTHIFRGDVFQIVPSRKFKRRYEGDDFHLYRTLRSINPSPYLFYFDTGDARLLGSSPEAQILVEDGRADIRPIAGTYRRSGDEQRDLALAEKLKLDPKENAEHVMLVDLARNDLSKHCNDVRVDVYREVQTYSHVIHLVSKVSGMLSPDAEALAILADTFPAGTLTGAPKYKAMELIDRYERGARGFYGGAVGFLGFEGECVHAIMIRSMLSRSGTLYYQAGGGVVADSDVASEVAEVKGKLAALTAAIDLASAPVQEGE